MAPNDIKEILARHPFQPIRVILSNGMHYDILEDATAGISRLEMYIGIEPDESGMPTRSVYIDPRHVTWIEPLVNGEDSNGVGRS